MDEAGKRVWEVRIGVATLALTVLGLLFAIWQLRVEGAREREAAAYLSEAEFARQLWLDQYETYRKVSGAVGRLVSALDSADREAMNEAERDFLALYWGPAIYVEDEAVEKAMISFRAAVRQHREGMRTDDQLRHEAKSLNDTLKASVLAGDRAAALGHFER